MKRFATGTFVCLVLTLLTSGNAQTPTNEQQLMLLIQEVEAQQVQISENQTKIETKLTEIGESVRQGRIFGARSN